MTEQWQELKETIIELRDNNGTGTQHGVCKFLVNYMNVLEKQMQESMLDKIRAEIEALPKTYPFINHIDTYVKEDDVKKIIDKYKKGEQL